jgi:hypothetical protein
VKYDVARNPSKLARTGTLSIAGFLHVIVQEP